VTSQTAARPDSSRLPEAGGSAERAADRDPFPSRPPSREIVSIRVDATSYEEAVRFVVEWARKGESRYVCVATVNQVMEAWDSPRLRRVMNAADLVTPDGVPLVWALRALGLQGATRVYGPYLTPRLLAAAEREGLPVGFYGAAPETLERLLGMVRRNYPKLRVAYAWSPPFRPLTPEEDEEVTGKINSSGARILFIGLSSPKQDEWMHRHRGRVEAVMLGVGAAFDFLAGTKRQAPAWLMPLGLEWLFRLLTEPRRLWKRYLKHNPRFVALFARQWLRSRWPRDRNGPPSEAASGESKG